MVREEGGMGRKEGWGEDRWGEDRWGEDGWAITLTVLRDLLTTTFKVRLGMEHKSISIAFFCIVQTRFKVYKSVCTALLLLYFKSMCLF